MARKKKEEYKPVVVVVGSRTYSNMERVRKTLKALLPENCKIVSGGAPGIDRAVIKIAKELGRETEEIPAQWTRPDGTTNRAAGLERNTTLAERATFWVIAFWDGKSRGTKDTILKAHKLDKRVTVVYPDGRVRDNKLGAYHQGDV